MHLSCTAGYPEDLMTLVHPCLKFCQESDAIRNVKIVQSDIWSLPQCVTFVTKPVPIFGFEMWKILIKFAILW